MDHDPSQIQREYHRERSADVVSERSTNRVSFRYNQLFSSRLRRISLYQCFINLGITWIENVVVKRTYLFCFFCIPLLDLFPFRKYGSRTLHTPSHFSNFWSHFFGFWSQSAREIPTNLKIGVGVFSRTLNQKQLLCFLKAIEGNCQKIPKFSTLIKINKIHHLGVISLPNTKL